MKHLRVCFIGAGPRGLAMLRAFESTRAALHDYIVGRVKKSGVRKYIEFKTPVR